MWMVVAVFTDNTLGYEDGVFEVVAVPRHERHAHVLTERQFTEVGGRTSLPARRRVQPARQRLHIASG